ncbi:hypothetical protein K1T71_002864 [Dendrolimus kikuchii]|uniref:Uncharacterized protein n=1 Tax=Dendrolimus kikuchii TaxID=765133 RepID=A0ACC1DEW5_9NEOP|nr:hypothetical protein K1T71_002864 [Dendrolimus kikuchii]
MAKCAACGKFLSQTGAASCSGCPCMFHKVCVAIPDNGIVPKNWTCPECKKKIRKSDNTDTPVKGVCGTNSPPTISSVPHLGSFSCIETQKHINLPEPLEEESEIRAMRRELAEYMCEIRNEMHVFRSSLAGIAQRFDGIEQRLVNLEQRQMDSGMKNIAELENAEALLADLDIGCLPEENGENTVHIVTVVASKLGVTIESRDIVYAERIGTARSVAAATDAGRKARRVVVRLARRDLRDELLHAARVRRNLTTADMGFSGPSQRVFINERLTRTNRQLFHRVREESNWIDSRSLSCNL